MDVFNFWITLTWINETILIGTTSSLLFIFIIFIKFVRIFFFAISSLVVYFFSFISFTFGVVIRWYAILLSDIIVIRLGISLKWSWSLAILIKILLLMPVFSIRSQSSHLSCFFLVFNICLARNGSSFVILFFSLFSRDYSCGSLWFSPFIIISVNIHNIILHFCGTLFFLRMTFFIFIIWILRSRIHHRSTNDIIYLSLTIWCYAHFSTAPSKLRMVLSSWVKDLWWLDLLLL